MLASATLTFSFKIVLPCLNFINSTNLNQVFIIFNMFLTFLILSICFIKADFFVKAHLKFLSKYSLFLKNFKSIVFYPLSHFGKSKTRLIALSVCFTTCILVIINSKILRFNDSRSYSDSAMKIDSSALNYLSDWKESDLINKTDSAKVFEMVFTVMSLPKNSFYYSIYLILTYFSINHMLLTILIFTFLVSKSKWTNLELFPVHSNNERFRWHSVSKLCKVTLILSILVNSRYFFEYSSFNDGELVFTDRIISNDVFGNNSRLNHKYNFDNDDVLNISYKTYHENQMAGTIEYFDEKYPIPTISMLSNEYKDFKPKAESASFNFL